MEEVHYTICHKNRRSEGIPILINKFKKNLKIQFSDKRVSEVMKLFEDDEKLLSLPVKEFVDLFIPETN